MPGIDGFLGTRASLMLDVVFLAMFGVLLALSLSVWLVRSRKNFVLHKRIQIVLGLVLLVTVTLFEIDMRVNGWQSRALASPYFGAIEQPSPMLKTLYQEWLGRKEVPGWVFTSLYIHLFFAVTTTLLWVFVIVQAVRKIPSPPAPCAYSAAHKRWARIAAIDMGFTALTGWVFYCLAFVAS
jgi:putative membrane protein